MEKQDTELIRCPRSDANHSDLVNKKECGKRAFCKGCPLKK